MKEEKRRIVLASTQQTSEVTVGRTSRSDSEILYMFDVHPGMHTQHVVFSDQVTYDQVLTKSAAYTLAVALVW